jgi:hypothetical protein
LKDIIRQVGQPDKSGIGKTIAIMDMGSGKEGEAVLEFVEETDLTQAVSFRIV